MPVITGYSDPNHMSGAVKHYLEKGVSSFGFHYIRNIIKGFVKVKLKDVRPDQLWTQITDGIPPEDIWDTDFGTDLPEGTVNIIRGVISSPIARGSLKEISNVLDDNDRAMEEMEQILKEARPDLYNVLLTTPGGRSLLAAAVKKMKTQFEQLVKQVESNAK